MYLKCATGVCVRFLSQTVDPQVLVRWATQIAGVDREALDAKAICHLVEVLTKRKIPSSTEEDQDGVRTMKAAFQLLEEAGLQAASLTCSPVEIASCDQAAVDSLLWSLAETFAIAPRFAGPENSGSNNWRNALMAWCQSVCSQRGVRISDFHRSWQNGLAFCALVDSALPDASIIGMQSLSPSQPEANLHLSFAVAQRSLGVVPILEPSDLTKTLSPDER
jgi:hypothetical protein